MPDEHGDYAESMLPDKPANYWRMEGPMPDETQPLTAAEIAEIRAGLAETQAEMRAYPPGLNAHAQAVNSVGAFNASVATT